jgi:proliferating cell nuclear antigen
MDSSHVSLCAIVLKTEGFDHFRCDKSFALGMNFPNFAKILKCAGNDDVVTLRCEEDTDALTLVFESPNQDRISDFEFKLMDIETEHLGIPETEYKCSVRMPSGEFQRIIRDIAVFGDTCKWLSCFFDCSLSNFAFIIGTIAVTKEGIRFSATGDLGTGNILLKKNTVVDKDEEAVMIDMQEPVELNFALRYLTLFTKATALGPTVTLSLSPDIPVVIEYPVGNLGHIRYYLAPKIDEE